jgi:hypothetical protein
MITKYDVFNPIDASHVVVDTIEEAMQLRQQLMDPWMEDKLRYCKSIHTITTINTLDNGDAIMSPIDLQGK